MSSSSLAPNSGVFARKATGLVREGSAWSVFVYNMTFMSIGMMLVFALSLNVAFYPGSNVLLTILICLMFVLPTAFVFAMMAAAMPRSGGDYVYVSRVLGPALGMMSSLNNTVWWIVYGGVPSAFFAYYGLTPLLRGIGVMANNPTLVGWGNDLSSPVGAFVTGALLIIALVGIFIIGLGTYFKIQNALFVLSLVGLIVTVVVLATSNHAGFVAAFNHYLPDATGRGGAYAGVLAAAKKGGFTTAPFSLYWTLIPMTWIYLELVYNNSAAYIGGEVKRPRSVLLWSMPLAAVVAAAAALLVAWLMTQVVGTTFLGAASYDAGQSIGFASAPVYTELVSYASRNVVVGFIVTFTFIFFAYTWLPGQILNASRNLLAYGIDGVMPAWLGKVSEKRHTPVNALIVMGAGSILALLLYVQPNSPFKTLTGIFGVLLTFMMVSISAILFPFKKRELWRTSPVNWCWGALPMVTVVGAVSLVAEIFMAWDFLSDPLSGISITPQHTGGILGYQSFLAFILDILIFLSGFAVYHVAKRVRARQGFDLDSTYQELPIE